MGEGRMEIKNLRENPEHLERLAIWHHNQWGYLNTKNTLEKRLEQMQRHLKDNIIPSTFIALDESLLLGSAAIVESDMDTKPELTPWLASVYVDPKARGRGVGSALVLRIMKHAGDNQIKKLYLYTPDKESFYRKIGWRTIEKTKYLGENVTIMELTFSE
jgi:N-acetylglutamate synthase-like GNAT family acetyltransferase